MTPSERTGVTSDELAPERVLELLASTPGQIARLVRGCPIALLERAPAPEAWSARDIVAHLRACADVWGGGIERMLAEDHPTIRYVSPRGWMRKSGYLQVSLDTSLRAFTQTRASLVETLETLTVTQWGRGAKVTGTTAGATATVLGYATRMAEHEVGHLAQIHRALAP